MRIYFCSDIHGSDICWRKFLAAPKFYGADVLVLGGDVTGKFVVPIIREPGGELTSEFMGVHRRVSSAEMLSTLRRRIADSGQYPFETSREEYEAMSRDQSGIDALFKRLITERVAEWLEMADARLRGTGVRCLVSGGNDDFFEVDQALAGAACVEDPNGRVIELGQGVEAMGVGYGNITPWPCPRDIPEAELAVKIAEVADRVRRPETAIFNLHVPPYGTGLDMAPRLDRNLRMVMTGTGPEMIPVGSTAVLDAITTYQPMLSVHGHIHESKGVRRIGRTTAVNPGSEYAEGVLDGALIEIAPGRGVVSVQLVSG
ncbi:MAG TPA: metallophosphoesterase [Candidatus Binatia bacterium]|nr:metallophosphoesterase [Candidatus Binatia bacterium]